MIDDRDFGTVDTRGNWAPSKPISCRPAFDWPPWPTRPGLSPAQGDTGFDSVVVRVGSAVATGHCAHFRRHNHFEATQADGMVPFDRWFGPFRDGTPEAPEAMSARRMGRNA